MNPPQSSWAGIDPTGLGNALAMIMMADDIQPGDAPSYELCKAIYLTHPLGAKMAESPIRLAQSQEREISVPVGPEEAVVEAFTAEWKQLEATRNILNVMTQSKIYGIASVVMGSEGTPPDRPINMSALWNAKIYFNVLDPLNTSGLVVEQNPNSPIFQKHGDLRVQGQTYHRSRSCTVMNEESIYIAWTSSAFGYVGRSVYQRALYPLKSFVQTMITDDMVTRKVGVLIAKMEAPGSIIDQAMKGLFALKRALLKQASTENVMSIGLKESIESLNLQNLDAPLNLVRNNIIKNIATAVDYPAKLLTQESFVEGFGEGTEDAKAVAQFIDRIRIEMNPVYDFFDGICMARAWNPDWYETIQERYPEEYGKKGYKQAFYEWKNAFRATWPSLLKEEPSETATIDDIKLKALIAVVQVFAPLVDPANQARVLEWAVDNLNTHETLFEGAKLELDMEELVAHLEDQKDKAEEAATAQAEDAKPNKPFSGHDAAAVSSLAAWMGNRVERPKRIADR